MWKSVRGGLALALGLSMALAVPAVAGAAETKPAKAKTSKAKSKKGKAAKACDPAKEPAGTCGPAQAAKAAEPAKEAAKPAEPAKEPAKPAEPVKEAAKPAGNAALGAEAWSKDCKKCHGPEGKGKESKKIADMSTAEWQKKFSDADMRKILKEGFEREKDGVKQKMKPYDLPTPTVDALIAYMRGFAKK